MYFVVADDHGLVREALVPFIQKVDTRAVILEAANFDQALTLSSGVAERLRLVILDFKMPGMNGVAGVKVMRDRHAESKIVILSGNANRSEALATLRGGADGFIPKSLNGAAMINALRLVLSGEQYFPSMLFHETVEAENSGTVQSLPGLGAALTPQEREALELLIEGLSNKEIAQRLHLQEVTIKKRLSSAYRKLGVSSRLQAVQVVNMTRQS